MTDPDRQFEEALRAVEKFTAAQHAALTEQVKDLFETERRAADMLRNEHQRASDVAEKEREKSAQALRDAMDRAREEGDNNLRQHIDNQVQQIGDALVSAEKLEIQRVESIRALVQGVEREIKLAQDASEKAIQKAERAAHERFQSVNEFRGQLSDQSKLFLPRETYDATLLAWTNWRDGIERRLNRAHGGLLEERRHEDRMQPWQLWAVGAVMTAVLAALVIVVNVLTTT